MNRSFAVATALVFVALQSPQARAEIYVEINTYSGATKSQAVRRQLENDGFPVVERLVTLEDGRTGVLVLVGPYDRNSKARMVRDRLADKGWPKLRIQRYEPEAAAPPVKPKPKFVLQEPPVPKVRRELEWPPAMVEKVPVVSTARTKRDKTGKTKAGEGVVAMKTPGSTSALPGVALKPEESMPLDERPFTGESRKEKGAIKWSGRVALEGRYFPDDPLYPGQKNNTASVVFQPELYKEWSSGNSITFSPFLRFADKDSERNHFDVRELMWLGVDGDWELRAGVGRVFWGVTESQHLVDVINQTDLVESPDGEDKLGQPMVNLTWVNNYGTYDLFVLPGFRERTFPGVKGRLRGPLVVDTEQDALYESEDGKDHVDWAARWSHYFGDLDISLSHFSGTSREPTFNLGINAQGQTVLIPKYNLMDQTGMTLQYVAADWLWKLEATSTDSSNSRYFAMTGGFEYTYVGMFGTYMDLGILSEYLYDDRNSLATTPFENDLMFGLRWIFNDVQSTEILWGVIYDLDGHGASTSLEASRRLGDSWKLGLEYRGTSGTEPGELLYQIRSDDFVQLELSYYF